MIKMPGELGQAIVANDGIVAQENTFHALIRAQNYPKIFKKFFYKLKLTSEPVLLQRAKSIVLQVHVAQFWHVFEGVGVDFANT